MLTMRFTELVGCRVQIQQVISDLTDYIVRSLTVLENMIGAVGSAIVEDRLARALKNARIAEVTAERKAKRVRTRRGTWRHTVARAQIAIIARLAQPRTRPQRQTTAHAARDVTA